MKGRNGYINFWCHFGNIRGVLTLAFLLYSYFGNGQISSAVDTTSIRIGEEIQFTIEVEADSTALVLFPEGQSFLPLEVIESYKTDTSKTDAKYRLIKKYGLTQFDSGSYILPSQRIIINDRPYLTDSLLIEVLDVPVDTTKQKMFDIKPVIEVGSPPFNWLKWLLILLAIAAFAGLVFYYFRRKKIEEEKKKQLPPYEEAMHALQALDKDESLIQQDSKAYYSSLTEIVKRYIDREVDPNALESTTDELIQRLELLKDAGQFEFNNLTIQKLDEVLKRADLVKFAKMRQEGGQARADRQTIGEIIDETKEALPEPTEEELLQNEVYAKEQQIKRLRRKRWRIAMAASATLVLILLVFGWLKGFDTVSDTIFGNEMKSLAEGRWYKSEYGNPALIVETPEVLKRKEDNLPENAAEVVSSYDVFTYGGLGESLGITISTSTYKEGIEVALEQVAELTLSALEANGANNMIAKQEQFTIEESVAGKKYFGNFIFKPKGSSGGKEVDYELLLFQQGSAVQQILITIPTNNDYASEIKNRIIGSLELEVSENQGEK